jgi:hypothetical protein
MNLRNEIEDELKKAVEIGDEKSILNLCKTYKNYFSALDIALNKKMCGRCGKILPDSAFNKRKNAYKGLQNTCKNCLTEYQNTWYKKNQSKILKKREHYRVTHQKEIKELRKKYNSSMHGKIIQAKKDARRRGLGFNLLYPVPNDWHGDIDYCFHHINNTDVVALPLKIHNKYNVKSQKKHRELLEPYVNTLYKNKRKAS